MAKGLTARQQRFVEEYLQDLNATKAAIRAGYSAKTPRASHGRRLLSNPAVAAAIRKAQDERARRTGIDADWVLNRLAVEAEADVADLVDEDGKIKPVREWPLIWRQGLVAGMDVSVIAGDGDSPVATVTKLKLSDRVRRLELIGKHVNVGAFAEKHEHKGEIQVVPVLNVSVNGGS